MRKIKETTFKTEIRSVFIVRQVFKKDLTKERTKFQLIFLINPYNVRSTIINKKQVNDVTSNPRLYTKIKKKKVISLRLTLQ